MKPVKLFACLLALVCLLAACKENRSTPTTQEPVADAISILLSDQGITADGMPVGTENTAAVYTANDIVYYESGKDFTYGEGTQEDAHSAEKAAEHQVVHITQPGVYRLSGKLSKGQVAVDLGEGAKENPDAVVTLILDGVDITCQVAPAVIFYNVYECGDPENPSKDVDTTAAGANVILADGSENTVNGAYVARIYKPDSVVLNAVGTEVEDAKKLHKYDGAFYSKMSMNISGNTGVLHINAENEGLDSEMHLTINGGNINILSGNDGINTNEDGVSVTTVNGGVLNIRVTGQTGEGDGIDSNGWLVINGGTVIAAACSDSADAGIDSDMGIHINGGTVLVSGHMLDRIEDGSQTYGVFTFAEKQNGTDTIRLKNEDGAMVFEHCPENDYTILIYSSPDLKAGVYTLWNGTQQLAGQTGAMGQPGGMRPTDGMTPADGFGNGQPQMGEIPPEGMTPPENFGDRQPPEGVEQPELPPDGMEPPQKPDNGPGRNPGAVGEQTGEFKIAEGANMFSGIAPLTESQ